MSDLEKLGPYIAFEGLQKCGKSTQIRLLVPKLQFVYPDKEIVVTREPGGTPLADAIRSLAQGPEFKDEMNEVCEAYLYSASRAQSLRSVVRPAQQRGAIVISDRTFYSSMAIQGGARKMGELRVRDINREAVNAIKPQIVYFLDEDPQVCAERSRIEKDEGDKFEGLQTKFYEDVRQGYLVAQWNSGGVFETISTYRKSVDEVHGLVVVSVLKFLDEYFA